MTTLSEDNPYLYMYDWTAVEKLKELKRIRETTDTKFEPGQLVKLADHRIAVVEGRGEYLYWVRLPGAGVGLAFPSDMQPINAPPREQG